MDGERQHAPAQGRGHSFRVERAEVAQQGQRAFERPGFGRFQPRIGRDVAHAERLEGEEDFRGIDALDFGQVVAGAAGVLVFRPEADGAAGRGAAGAAGALVGGGAGDVFDQQRVDAAPGIEARHAREAGVDHEADAVDGQRGFRNIGGDDDFPPVVAGDGGVLVVGRQFAVEWEEERALGGGGLAEGFDRALDFIGAGHEDERVAGVVPFARGAFVGLGGGVPRGVAVGMQRLGEVLDLDGKGAAFGADEFAGLQIRLEQARVERGGHRDQQQVGPRGFLELEGLGEGDVAVDVALVEFVEQDCGDAGQVRLRKHLAQKDAFGLELDARGGAADGLEADLVADFAAELDAAFLGDALGQQARGEAAGLEHDGLAGAQRAQVDQHLRHLRGFARTGRRGQDDPPRAFQRGGQIVADGVDGQHGNPHDRAKRRSRQPPFSGSGGQLRACLAAEKGETGARTLAFGR